mmetsp:Transcript_175349/g.426530  ORF Transcript_175349/g.426530 Transcript_175349/m.426530 type:complete len:223 (-) Transcript_175349:250-918(-)
MPKEMELSTRPATSVDIRSTPCGTLLTNCQTLAVLLGVKGSWDEGFAVGALGASLDASCATWHLGHLLHLQTAASFPLRPAAAGAGGGGAAASGGGGGGSGTHSGQMPALNSTAGSTDFSSARASAKASWRPWQKPEARSSGTSTMQEASLGIAVGPVPPRSSTNLAAGSEAWSMSRAKSLLALPYSLWMSTPECPPCRPLKATATETMPALSASARSAGSL